MSQRRELKDQVKKSLFKSWYVPFRATRHKAVFLIFKMEMILPIYGIDVELFKKDFMNMKIKVWLSNFLMLKQLMHIGIRWNETNGASIDTGFGDICVHWR